MTNYSAYAPNAQSLYDGYTALGVPSSSASALAGVQAWENGAGALPNPGGDAPGVFGISQWTAPSRIAAANAAGIGPNSSLASTSLYITGNAN
jgi:hypothetical protein